MDPDLKKEISTGKFIDDNAMKSNLANHIKKFVMLTPLEVLDRSVKSYGVPDAISKDLFGAYSEFVKMLADDAIRKALKELRAKDSRTDATFQEIRKNQ